MEWIEVHCEQCYQYQICNRIQDHVTLRTAFKPPLLIYISVKNSDENMMSEEVEMVTVIPLTILTLTLVQASTLILFRIRWDSDRLCIVSWLL